MAKVLNPFFPEGIGCIKYRHYKNLKGNFTHVAFIKKPKRRKAGE